MNDIRSNRIAPKYLHGISPRLVVRELLNIEHISPRDFSFSGCLYRRGKYFFRIFMWINCAVWFLLN